MAELLTSRIDGDGDQGPELVTKFAQLEADLRSIFGIPADTAMSEAMDVGTGTNVVMTGSLSLAGLPTSDLMACSKSYLQTLGGAFGSVRCRAFLSSNVDVNTGVYYMPWSAADINVGSMWVGTAPSRFTIPEGEGGNYIIGVTASFDFITPGIDTWLIMKVHVNRLTHDGRSEIIEFNSDAEDEVGQSGTLFFRDLEPGDNVELQIKPYTGTVRFYSANTTMYAFKVS